MFNFRRKPPISLPKIDSIVREYSKALGEEKRAQISLEEMTEKLGKVKAIALQEAYQDDKIEVTNKDTRARDEAIALLESRNYQMLLGEYLRSKSILSSTKLKKEVVDVKISLYKAWLYSQSGLNNL